MVMGILGEQRNLACEQFLTDIMLKLMDFLKLFLKFQKEIIKYTEFFKKVMG